LIPNTTVHKVFRPIWDQVKHVWTRDIFRDVFHSRPEEISDPQSYVNLSLYFEAKTFLHGLLVVEDKLSMAHGLEARVPFLDNDLVDFAMRLPVKLKLGKITDVIRLNENEPGAKTQRYFQKTQDGKLILRQVMNRHIPGNITTAIKQGFSAPDASWFKGESIDLVKRIIFNKRSSLYEFMDAGAVQELVTEHIEGRTNRRLLIWSLLNFEFWINQYLRSGA
jgi:asparagine synthase (glutamine-hydrolysing)